ncbi:vitamin K epoxide reductase family protein [Vulcanisaeta thermophila]|uniref:vitamin K epoxide reductase family protein n=1 Tax=Vulcanisaeta thermophila TaxID=867917 RepID=UPI000852F4D9|nr:vitamin K epoxide reductase family protein [Vulcanisaeta thermophila]
MGRLTTKWLTLLLTFSVVGLFASAVVVYTYYYLRTLPPFCTSFKSPFPGVTADCEVVLSSRYSDVGGVPLDVLAAVWFVINIVLVIVYDLAGGSLALLAIRFLYFWRFIGIVVVPYLIYVEFFILHAICIYCTVMHIMIIVDFVALTLYLALNKPLR